MAELKCKTPDLKEEKPLTEIKTEEGWTKVEDYLCPECRPSGRCKYDSTGLVVHRGASDKEIKNWVEVRTRLIDSSTKTGKKLQEAHDLFHQDEYEQASYVYQDILQSRNDYNEGWVGLSASFYFLGRYEEAAGAAEHIPFWSGHAQFIERFLLSCEKKGR